MGQGLSGLVFMDYQPDLYIGKHECVHCHGIYPAHEMRKKKGRRGGVVGICLWCNRKLVRLKRGFNYMADPELRKRVMDEDLPMWHERLRLIAAAGLDMDDEADTAKIDLLLERAGNGHTSKEQSA